MSQRGKRPLGFCDHHRQHYADKVPISDAGEFLVGDYEDDGTLAAGGEFRVALVELSADGRWRLYPHLETFGDGTGSLRRAIDAGLLDSLSAVSDRDEFARRLLSIGMIDRSDCPLPGADGEREARRPPE